MRGHAGHTGIDSGKVGPVLSIGEGKIEPINNLDGIGLCSPLLNPCQSLPLKKLCGTNAGSISTWAPTWVMPSRNPTTKSPSPTILLTIGKSAFHIYALCER